MPMEAVNSSAVTLTWNPPDMPNGVIASYTVNLVATSSNAGITESGRRRRQVVEVVSDCVMRNGGAVESNITVGPDQTSLQVNNLGEVFVIAITACKHALPTSLVFSHLICNS